MIAYIRWSLRQMYLLVFWPSRIMFELVDKGRTSPTESAYRTLKESFKHLPWLLIVTLAACFLTGCVCELYGVSFNWIRGGAGVVFGVILGLVAGVALSRADSTYDMGLALGLGVMGLGVWLGLWLGVALGVAGGVAFGVAFGVGFGVSVGVCSGVVGMMPAEIRLYYGMAAGVGSCLWVDVLVGMASGVAVGVAVGVAFAGIFFRLVTYPFDLLLALYAYLTARRRPESAFSMWRWCPVFWNEVIWIPLPFVGKFLALLVKQDREEGFRQIAFVAAERSLQGRAARVALMEVALNDLKAATPAEIAKATEKLSWTTDAPLELPSELTAAIPRFDRAATYVDQFLTLNSPYRKGEALEKASAEVQQLQQGLITARGRFAPRLLRTANEWKAIIETELESFKAHGELKRSIPNPFVYGTPVAETDKNVFTGRRDLVRAIEESVLNTAQPPTLLLQGPRRMGKSSILNQLPRLLGPDFAPASVDCQSAAVTESLFSLLGYLSRSISDTLRRRRVSINPLSSADLSSEPFNVFEQWLDRAEKEMPPNLRILLAIDEYEKLGQALDKGWGASFLDTLRNWFQHRPRLVLMFTGARTIDELGPAWTDRFISVRRVRVSFLSYDDVLPLLTKPIPEFNMTYAEGAIDAIFTATHGQPFLTQATAFELVQYLNEGDRTMATQQDVKTAIDRALISGSPYFANVWSDAKDEGQAILTALAQNQTPPNFPRATKWLRENEVLTDDLTFQVPMMEQWVRAKISE